MARFGKVPSEDQTIPGLLNHYHRQLKRPDFVAAIWLTQYRRQPFTFNEMIGLVQAMRIWLAEQNLQKGDRVLVCAPNSPWWTITFLACAHDGIVVIPLDLNSEKETIKKVTDRTKPRLYIRSLLTPSLGVRDLPEVLIENLPGLAHDASGNLPESNVEPNDLLEIVFTSGSTGDPKGVLLTHRNVASNIQNLLTAWPLPQKYRFLSIIPLSHMFEQTVGFLAPFISGNTVVYPASIKPLHLQQALKQEKINFIVGVPALLQLLEHKIRHTAQQKGKDKLLGKLLGYAQRVPFPLRRFVFASIHRQFGGELRLIAVGGAPLPAATEEFWETIGVGVLQGYGLTETGPVATLSLPANRRRQSVGKCLPGQELKIAKDGEILLKGPNVTPGYYQNAKLTAELIKGGWYHSGDIGEVDAEGYVFIKGRKKYMLLSASGMNVYPEDIENQVLEQPGVRDCVIIDTGRDGDLQLTAILLPYPDAKLDPKAVLKAANRRLASHQQLQQAKVWQESDFPRTPTRKVKRQEVVKYYQEAAAKAAPQAADKTKAPDEVLRLISETTGRSLASIKEKSVLATDLGLDSVKRIELVSHLEDTLGKRIDESAITPRITVAGLRKLIKTAPPPDELVWHPPAPIPAFLRQVAWRLGGPLLRRFLIAYAKLQVDRPMPLPSEPVVFAANHLSYLDGYILYSSLPAKKRHHLSALVVSIYFHGRLRSAFMKGVLRLIPVYRNEGLFRQSLAATGYQLSCGNNVMVFPEGARSISGKMQPFQSGIGLLAQALHVPIVPVKIIGTHEMWPPDKPRPVPGEVSVRFGEPYYPDYSETPQQITQKLQDMIKKL